MSNILYNQNAKIALKQIKMETAVDYGISSEDIFDIIENAHNNGILPERINYSPIRKKSNNRKLTYLE